jgi:transcriptional regulator with GAF, ATPase, and Fis domain
VRYLSLFPSGIRTVAPKMRAGIRVIGVIMLKLAKTAFDRTLGRLRRSNSFSHGSVLNLAIAAPIVENNQETSQARLDTPLDLIVRTAQQKTNASGAVVALLRGHRMVCAAQAGAMVPRVGTPVELDAGLTGACVHSGKPLCCNDTATDPRVNRDVCLKFGIRSVLVVPIRKGDREFVGILEVVSNEANAFDRVHIDSLKVLAWRCSAYAEQTVENRPLDEKSPSARAAKQQEVRAANDQDRHLQFCETQSLNTCAREDSLHTVQNSRPAEKINATDLEGIIDRISCCTSWDDVCSQLDGDYASAPNDSSE